MNTIKEREQKQEDGRAVMGRATLFGADKTGGHDDYS